MKKLLFIFCCIFMVVSCDKPKPTCVVIEKRHVEHRISSDEYYVITKSIYNREKKIASVTESQFYLYSVGDTIVEPRTSHK
jgi:hypothetical protein